MDESVRFALLVVLERMSPAERVVFVLHDVFDFPFEKIAPMVGRTVAACRQLASRGRKRVEEEAGAGGFSIDPRGHRRVGDAFIPPSAGAPLPHFPPLLPPPVLGR